MDGRPDRLAPLDALRGVAIVWMVGFHFCFDLNFNGLWQPRQHFTADPFWTLQRSAIVSLFLLCAGMGQAMAVAAGQSWPRFWMRWRQVALCAVGVSLGSALVFPRSWIAFGVLHGMAVMLPFTRWALLRIEAAPPAHRRTVVALIALAGGLALMAPRWWADPAFNGPWWRWTGLVTRLPLTEDYVPVLPWLGLMLWGGLLGRAWRAWRAWALRRPAVDRPGAAWPLRALTTLGRWPLSVYMLHQPLLLGAIWLVLRLSGR